jgi:hypothetical protein
MAGARTAARGGFALAAVLWLLLILSVIGAMPLRCVESERDQAALEIARCRARLAADAGINRAILSLVDPQDPLKWRLDGTGQTLRILDRDVQVAVESEAAKIDLNQAQLDLLAALPRARRLATPARWRIESSHGARRSRPANRTARPTPMSTTAVANPRPIPRSALSAS